MLKRTISIPDVRLYNFYLHCTIIVELFKDNLIGKFTLTI